MNPDKNNIFAPTSLDESLQLKFLAIFFPFMFYFFIIHYLIVSLFIVKAQQPTQEWVRRYTDTSSSYWGGMSIKTR